MMSVAAAEEVEAEAEAEAAGAAELRGSSGPSTPKKEDGRLVSAPAPLFGMELSVRLCMGPGALVVLAVLR